jgi:hypothetical protein
MNKNSKNMSNIARGGIMKRLLIGLLTLGSISVSASPNPNLGTYKIVNKTTGEVFIFWQAHI